ncbi:hypothetical protein LTR94_030904, partial [Friedmanniomyces endolithicus]
MGLVKPDSGRIMLDGHDITGLPMYRRAILGLGYLPQETSIFRGLTIEKNILTVLELAEPDAAARAEKLEKLLGEFGLTRLRDAPAMALSGGERRRAEIARALAADPSIMLLDEPFGALDALTRGTIQDELLGICAATRQTVFMITHDVDEAILLADRIFLMSNGPRARIAEIV